MSDQKNLEARHKESWLAGCPAGCTICIPQVGRKDDTGKAPFSLLPWAGVQQILKVLAYGAKKYAPENWRKVPDGRRRYFDAALRHLTAWYGGEDLDPESGLPHLAHAGCCVLFLLEWRPDAKP